MADKTGWLRTQPVGLSPIPSSSWRKRFYL